MTKGNGQPYHLSCTCCGKYVLNTPENNVCYHDEPYPQDTGFGQCRECFGHASEETTFGDLSKMSDEEVWKFLGWAEETFYKSRIEILTEKLNEKNATKFQAMPLWRKIRTIQHAIEKGMMI